MTSMSELGLYGIPDGNPGFTAIVEIDADWDGITDEQRAQLRLLSSPQECTVSRSKTGGIKLTFGYENCGWYKAGNQAMSVVEKVDQDWPISTLQICRSDYWRTETALEVSVEARPPTRTTSPSCGDGKNTRGTLAIELDANWDDLSDNERARPNKDSGYFLYKTQKSRFGRVEVLMDCDDWTYAFTVGAKLAHSLSDHWPIVRIKFSCNQGE